LRQATSELDNVEVVGHQGLLVELATTRGVSVVVRGVGREPVGELEMAEMNARVGRVRTMFLQPSPSTAHISSRMIRALVSGGEVSRTTELVPSVVATALVELEASSNPASNRRSQAGDRRRR
jgi:phosphopantetheine adenylyltransferase